MSDLKVASRWEDLPSSGVNVSPGASTGGFNHSWVCLCALNQTLVQLLQRGILHIRTINIRIHLLHSHIVKQTSNHCLHVLSKFAKYLTRLRLCRFQIWGCLLQTGKKIEQCCWPTGSYIPLSICLCVSFPQYLGSMLVKELRGTESTQDACAKMRVKHSPTHFTSAALSKEPSTIISIFCWYLRTQRQAKTARHLLL